MTAWVDRDPATRWLCSGPRYTATHTGHTPGLEQQAHLFDKVVFEHRMFVSLHDLSLISERSVRQSSATPPHKIDAGPTLSAGPQIRSPST